MHRRAYLALLTASLAGCAGSDEPSTDEPTEDATPTASATPTGTDASTSTPTETDEPTATPSDESIADDHLDAADGHLQDAVAAFTAPAGGGDLLSVDGSVEPDVGAVTDALDAMAGELDAAAEHATESQQATVEDLRHLRAFLADLVAGRSDAHDLWTAAREGIAAGIRESFDEMGQRRNELTDHREAVGGVLESLAENADPGATEVTSAIGKSEYTGTRDQLTAEHEAAGAVRDALPSMEDGMVEFADASDDYTAGRFSNAEVKFWSAQGAFEDARDAVPGEPPDAYASMIADLDSFLATVYEVSELLERSARLGREKVSEDEAQAILAESDLVPDSPSASELLEWLQNR